jgi:hypothetical protein
MLAAGDPLRAKKRGKEVFQPRPEVQEHLQLPENRAAFYEDFIGDWLASFLFLVEKNAEGRLPSRFSAEDTRRLGQIIAALAA